MLETSCSKPHACTCMDSPSNSEADFVTTVASVTRPVKQTSKYMSRAKGLSGMRVFLWHYLPPAAPQWLALLAVSLSLALSAAVPVEVVCDLPGIGQLAWKAAMARDMYLLVCLTGLVTHWPPWSRSRLRNCWANPCRYRHEVSSMRLLA